MSVVLFGGTDLTLAVADRILALGVPLAAVVHVGSEIEISYAPGGMTNTRAAPVAEWCRAHDVATHEFTGVEPLVRFLEAGSFDLGLAAGWFHMLPRSVRTCFRRGCAGIHASLLPRFRGGAPLNWALIAGERETGVSLFELGDGVDDGPLYGQASFQIGDRATIAELVDAAEQATCGLVDELLPRLVRGELHPEPQVGTPSYSLQRRPEDGRIDWRATTAQIDALIRATGRPYPGARSSFEGADVLVWAAEPLDDTAIHGTPGQLARLPELSDPCVVTGDGALVLREVSRIDGAPVLDELRRAANRRLGS